MWAISWVLAAIPTLSMQTPAVQSTTLTQKVKNLKGREKLSAAAHVCNSWTQEANGRGAGVIPRQGWVRQHGGEGWKPVESWSFVALVLLSSEVQSLWEIIDPHCNVSLGRNGLFLPDYYYFFSVSKRETPHIAQGQNGGCPKYIKALGLIWSARGGKKIQLDYCLLKKFQEWDFK